MFPVEVGLGEELMWKNSDRVHLFIWVCGEGEKLPVVEAILCIAEFGYLFVQVLICKRRELFRLLERVVQVEIVRDSQMPRDANAVLQLDIGEHLV